MSESLRLLRFVLVGIWNTTLDLSLFWVFLNLAEKFKIRKLFFLKIATVCHIIAFLITNSQSYILNSMFTFADSDTNSGWLPYLGVSAFSLGISSLLVQFLNKESYFIFLNKRFSTEFFNAKRFALAVKLFTVFITMFSNYIGYKYLVYGF
jgi:putative flippase GtrA